MTSNETLRCGKVVSQRIYDDLCELIRIGDPCDQHFVFNYFTAAVIERLLPVKEDMCARLLCQLWYPRR